VFERIDYIEIIRYRFEGFIGFYTGIFGFKLERQRSGYVGTSDFGEVQAAGDR
jgi:hypothetical protein